VDLRTERVTGGLLPSPFRFQKHGRSGIEVSELLPQLASVIDEICVLRSVYTFNPTHTPARNLIHSGNIAATRPSLGAWISYGLGTENANLPAFVVLSPSQTGGSLWRSGFLPAEHQGTHFNHSQADPDKMIRYLRNDRLDAAAQRRQLDLVGALNREHMREFGADGFLDARIRAMETAYRMQMAATDAFDLRDEPESVRDQYGTTPYANGCLMARRLVERGVRYIHIYYGQGQPWDDHKGINKNLRERCPDMDQASAALIVDLKRRGLLDETLIVWGGEFGRTPVSENGDGRGHNPYGFTMWMAGGGIRSGLAFGATDEFGFQAVENRVSIHDLHATILHQLGIDHERLTYRYAGRDFRLTDVHGRVVREILA
jgi:arylsulfatase A-like enzyme